MITIQNTFDAEGSYPLARLGDPASLLFFDIETTGFSGDFCTVYLIGCVFLRKAAPILSSGLPIQRPLRPR